MSLHAHQDVEPGAIIGAVGDLQGFFAKRREKHAAALSGKWTNEGEIGNTPSHYLHLEPRVEGSEASGIVESRALSSSGAILPNGSFVGRLRWGRVVGEVRDVSQDRVLTYGLVTLRLRKGSWNGNSNAELLTSCRGRLCCGGRLLRKSSRKPCASRALGVSRSSLPATLGHCDVSRALPGQHAPRSRDRYKAEPQQVGLVLELHLAGVRPDHGRDRGKAQRAALRPGNRLQVFEAFSRKAWPVPPVPPSIKTAKRSRPGFAES